MRDNGKGGERVFYFFPSIQMETRKTTGKRSREKFEPTSIQPDPEQEAWMQVDLWKKERAPPVPAAAPLLVQIWRTELWHQWTVQPPGWHQCRRSEQLTDVHKKAEPGCPLEKLQAILYPHTDTAVTQVLRERGAAKDLSPHGFFHVCLPGACRLPGNHPCHAHSDGTQLRVACLYVCKDTAQWHLCGPHCDAKPMLFNADHLRVCPLTGILLGWDGKDRQTTSIFFTKQGAGGSGGTGSNTSNSGVSTLSNRLVNPLRERGQGYINGATGKRNTKLHDNRGQEDLLYELEVTGGVGAIAEDGFRSHQASLLKAGNLQRAVNAGRLTNHEGISTKTRYLNMIRKKLFNLFSGDRFQKEMQCNREVEHEIDGSIRRYIHVQNTAQTLVVASDLALLAENSRVKTPSLPRGDPPQGE